MRNAEARFLDARDLADQIELGEARGTEVAGLSDRLDAALAGLRAEVAGLSDRLDTALAGRAEVAGLDPARLGPADAAALAAMRRWLDRPQPPPAGKIIQRYAAAQAAVAVGGTTMTRLAVLGRLALEPSAALRHRLFLALEPVWRSVDGDGAAASPYRGLLRTADVGSALVANARALGLDPARVEPSLVEILEAWRSAAAPGARIEPWDWWYAAGGADRALASAIPLDRLRPLSDAYHSSLGADPARLGIGFDVVPRPDRPPVPVAYTTFGSRPRLRSGGGWTRAEPWVLGTYTHGGLGELTELIHETGHAIHVAGIHTRPAFADWPDSDAFTEALAELTALDTAEPAWQRRWLGAQAPAGVSLRGRYADVMLDICWALLELRLHAGPRRRPNDVWTELTSTYLGIAPHPEFSWWAMRGQLVQEPGYMVNYAIAPIIAADLRAAIRAVRGDWVNGDPGWYAWVCEHLYRWGLERPAGDVLRDVLGRPPSHRALLGELGRISVGVEGSRA